TPAAGAPQTFARFFSRRAARIYTRAAAPFVMEADHPGKIETLLAAVNAGAPGALEDLSRAVHEELRAMARRKLVRDFGRDMAGVTIQPTALANDTLMRLIRQRQKYDNA